MNDHDKDYVMHIIELESIIHALKMSIHYLLCRRFILMSDHSGLRYLFAKTNMYSRKARWLTTLSEFEFEIKYIKGKENRVVYDLIRRV